MKHFQSLTFLLFSFPIFSQTPISGIINQYAKVLEINACEGKLTLASGANPFAEGDQVLLMQMKGATINAFNANTFGDLENLGGAGVFERNEVKTVSGSQVWLKYVVSPDLDASASVQLISLPKFTDAVVTDVLTAANWNGSTGGVLALVVEETLTLQASLDVSGKGFLGGSINVVNSNCDFLTDANSYYYTTTSWRGAPKGEGIAEFLPGKEHGRGAQANGGGGGNDHNSGGGGGGSPAGAGGGGGKQKGSSTFGCVGDSPGKGGKALPNTPDRIFLGGGGGSGHVDDDGAGSPGGNGGGIILLLAKNIEANEHGIISNGISPTLAIGDGAGGGGAGGSIFLQVESVQGNLSIQAKGGNGGNVQNEPNRCFGPGGGGSGGVLLANANNFTQTKLSGGGAGINTVASGQCNGASNGALAGADGILEMVAALPENEVAYLPTTLLAQPQPALGCEGQQSIFEFHVEGIFLSYRWQINTGNGWTDLSPTAGMVGIFESKITLTSPDASLDGTLFRCKVSSPCEAEFYSDAATLDVIAPPQPGFDFTADGNANVQFSNASLDAQTYLWDFGDGTTSELENPAHTFPGFGEFTVTLIATNDCGSATFTQNITLETVPQAGFGTAVQAGCAPLTVDFLNQSSDNSNSFEWHFPGGFPATSTAENPQVVFSQPGSFSATLIVKNSQGSDTLTFENFISVQGVAQVNFSASVSNLEAQFLNFSTNATGGYLWDFGDGTTSADASPTHTYSSGGFFNVTLTATNECGQASVSQTISSGAFPLAAFDASTEGGCAPIVVFFQNLSTGSNLSTYQWEFPGGEPAISNQPNPVVTYSTPGTYDVKLTVANVLGEHSVSKTGFVTVLESPEIAFTFSSFENTVSFVNESTGWTHLLWDFGDGISSTETHPSHTYSTEGIFTVTLTAMNLFCGGAMAQQVAVTSTSAGEANALVGMKIFPNPAVSFLHIEREEILAEDLNFRLLDASGNPAMTGKLEGKSQVILLADLAAGLYLLEIETPGGKAGFRIIKL